MQVNLHGSHCIPGVFLYCFGHRKKTKFSTKSPQKYAILTPKFQKKILGKRHCPLPIPLPLSKGKHPLSTPHPSLRLWRLDSARAFGPQLQLLDPPMIMSLGDSTENRFLSVK